MTKQKQRIEVMKKPNNTAKETDRLRMSRFHLLREACRYDERGSKKKREWEYDTRHQRGSIWERRPVTCFGGVGSPPKTKAGEEKGCTVENLLAMAD